MRKPRPRDVRNQMEVLEPRLEQSQEAPTGAVLDHNPINQIFRDDVKTVSVQRKAKVNEGTNKINHEK